MDLDAYIAAHRAEWQRLDELTRTRRLTGAQADEVLDLYQRVATHLSTIRSTAPDPSTVQYLSTLLARTRNRTSGTRTSAWSDLGRFFVDTFPAMLYRTRWWWGVTTALNLLVALAIGWYVARDPNVQSAFMSPEMADQVVNHDFEDYYSEFAAHEFAARVWTNNAWVAALCIAFGVLGAPVIYVLWQNVLNLGVMGGVMAGHGKASLFFGLITPHGLLELTAVFVAAGAGLRLFWSWIEPGARTRMQSLAAETRATMTIVLGLVVVLFISGLIEAFVTPSGLPTWARIAIGVVAEIAFLTYVFTLGRWAALRGETGDVDAADQAAHDPVAA